MCNASVAIQVLPKVEQTSQVVAIVDEVIQYIAGQNLNYFVGPFETVIEGDYDVLMKIVKECQKIAVKAGAPSVMSYVKISYHPNDEGLSIEEKTAKYH
ncbi:MAG: thiamine-binding protein [Eubacteriales bacterium]|nr:thiamine-binding protein [Eubacteriales bacterium]